jgi:hypothetical protein
MPPLTESASRTGKGKGPGRPKLPPSDDPKVNAKRKYYREYNRKRRQELLALGEEFEKDNKSKKTLEQKHKDCTNKVKLLTQNLKSAERSIQYGERIRKEMIEDFDKKLAAVLKRGKGFRRK